MQPVNRRNFLKLTGSGLIGLTLGGVALRTSAQEKLSPDNNATAAALLYVHKSLNKDTICDNCVHIQGEDGQEWRPCGIFPGTVVAAKGWCTAWMAMPKKKPAE
ncbi:MAG: hypothetical protein ACJAVV_003676 [Alphaproteobacteria bacterium]|jgi:hypothetical protein